jgi:hypothetical protein
MTGFCLVQRMKMPGSASQACSGLLRACGRAPAAIVDLMDFLEIKWTIVNIDDRY